MKKLSIILAAVMLLAISYSCSEDFFDKRPQGVTDETVFYSAKGIDALLLGTYGIVSGGAVWEVSWGASIQNWTYGSAASDDAYKGSELTDQVPANDIERWEVPTTNPYPGEKWKWAIGMGVNRANEVLRIINATEDITDDFRARKTAEARFLRALYNFEAWLVFKNIPIITEETENPSEVSNVNPEGAVLAHIISDLEYAWQNLPATQSDPGRPTRYSAMALAARAYLQVLDYSSAKPLLDNIINSGRFELMPNFLDNYRIAHNNNPESIFEIQANVNDGACCSGNAEMGIGLNWPHGGDIGMCCGFHQPSQNLVNAFRVDANGLPVFDQVNVHLKNDQGVASSATFVPFDDEVDPRLDWTVSRRGIPYRDWGIMRGRDWIRDQSNGGPYMPVSKPFFYQHERYSLSTTTGWMTGNNANNYRYIRYGHVLLWRAEVAAFENDLETARTYVNMIRERAGNEVVMGRVLITELPPEAHPWGPGTDEGDYMSGGDVDWDQPAANYNIGLYPAFADQAEAMRAVQWELRLEFATEGQRFFDLRRWDDLPAGLNSVPMAKTLNDFARADEEIRTFMRGATFTDRDRYQPIPQSQLDLQPDVLQQNPGY
ncbi:MAG: RagB/SusD family nutrient uptake outer membrane protein [Marinilabiliales bacterium]|nr:MAG: RagB/SusD family nutrient uptake outer membrane protein [Marinilabiliales bacterium]